MGKSVSTWVEGLLLIAVQRYAPPPSKLPDKFTRTHLVSPLFSSTTTRPFGLGDRITVASVDTIENPGGDYSWFVEG
jgi:hypothetical protein